MNKISEIFSSLIVLVNIIDFFDPLSSYYPCMVPFSMKNENTTTCKTSQGISFDAFNECRHKAELKGINFTFLNISLSISLIWSIQSSLFLTVVDTILLEFCFGICLCFRIYILRSCLWKCLKNVWLALPLLYMMFLNCA